MWPLGRANALGEDETLQGFIGGRRRPGGPYRRVADDAYFFLPGLLPRDAVAEVQRQLGTILRMRGGWRPIGP